MTLSRSLVVCLAAVVTLSIGSFATSARAGTVTYSGTSSLSPYLGASPYTFPAVNLPKFDDPGQCLTAVCVRLEGQTAGFTGIENFMNFPKVVTVIWGAKFDLYRPSLSPLLAVTPTTTNSYSLTAYDGIADYAGTSGITHTGLAASAADSLCLSLPADLALFAGPGTISLPCTAANISTHDGANSWSFGVLAAAIINVTYTYTPCATPAKPMTWGRLKTVYR